MNPRAVTGLGILSTLGIGREGFFAAMQGAGPEGPTAGEGAPRAALTSFDATAYPDANVAEVPDFEAAKYLGDKGIRTLDRLTKLLIVAARLALHDAGYKNERRGAAAADNAFLVSSPARVGLVCSNAYGSLEAITELDRVATLEDARYINPAKFPNTVSNSAAGYVSIWEDLRAMNVSVSDGNCGGLDAVACADIYLETGRADALLVGGAESMSEALYLAFHKLGAFDHATRIGEAAVLMMIEPSAHAQARGARVLGEIVGYGTAFVGPERDAQLIHASGPAMERAIAAALDDAGVRGDEIDVVASGVSGLRAFDDVELAAIARVVGSDAGVVAPKLRFGETLGAGGAMGIAATLAWLGGTPIGPLVHGSVRANVRTALVTAMGFYGNASAVVVRAGTF